MSNELGGLCGSSDIFSVCVIWGEKPVNFSSVFQLVKRKSEKKKKKFPNNLRELLKADFASFWGDFKSVGS